jgi:hypothetical protein
MHFSILVDPCSRLESLQIQSVEVEQFPSFWVSIQINLKPAIEAKAFHQVGPHPAAAGITRFQNTNRDTGTSQMQRTGQARHAGTHNDNWLL